MNADDFRRMLLDEIRNLSAILGVLASEVTKLRRAQESPQVKVPRNQSPYDLSQVGRKPHARLKLEEDR